MIRQEASRNGSPSFPHHAQERLRRTQLLMTERTLQDVLNSTSPLPHLPTPQQPRQDQTPCSLCGNNNYTLSPETIPYLYEHGQQIDEEVSCQDLDDFAQTLNINSDDCTALRATFLHSCCDTVPPRHECESKVRAELLSDYDPTVQPQNATHPSAPLDVQFHLNFFHITELNVQESTVEIFVHLTMLWKDERLAWDVNEQCAFDARFRASNDVEKTEIWVPDVDLYNQALGAQLMPEALAEVYSDGTVLWRRNGGLSALCLFSGLKKIPFDTLGCRFLMGPWTSWVTMILADGNGFGLGDFQAKYAEYRLMPDRVKTGYITDVNASQPNYGVYYDFYFERAQRFYVIGIIIPAILFTFLSFGMFLLDLRVGERLSFGMALLLVLAANSIVTAQYLPVTNERLFATTLINASFYWVMFGLMESVVVGYLFFVGHDAAHQHDQEPGGRHGNLEVESRPQLETAADDDVLEPIDEELDRTNEVGGNTGRGPSQRGISFGQSMRSVFTLKQTMMHRSGGETNPNRKLIRSIDKWCFRIVPTTYFVFLVVMFCTLPLWDETGEDIWGSEGDDPADEL